MKDYTTTSYWLETADDDLTPRPPLTGSLDVDVAILGAGYSGLWTAYYLLRRDPSLQIAILEREIAGFGASGRNGGWCSSTFPAPLKLIMERHGQAAARDLQCAMYETVDEVGRICREEGIDAHYVKGGVLRIARGPQELPAIETAYALYRQLRLGDHYKLLSRGETNARVRVAGAEGSLFSPECATVHPGRLVRGLARAVERRGAKIYEATAVTDFQTGTTRRLITAAGDVRAKTVVLCGEAYLSQLAKLHRQVTPLYSLIVLTEPLSESQWEGIGWEGNECLSSNRHTIDYLSRTQDGRILVGSRGAPYHWGSRIEDSYDLHEPTHQMIMNLALDWFPSLGGIRFTHTWGGPVGVPRDRMPTASYDPATGLATARGYTGQGVATTNLASRVLADLITGIDSPLTRLPLSGHRSRNWEPEPFRWLGMHYMIPALARLDEKARRTGRPPTGRSLAERLGRF